MREDMEAIRVMGFWYWLWCRTGGYRVFMRLAHRFNWHHCKVCGPFTDGSIQHWCQWCGLRYSTPPTDYAKQIHTSTVNRKPLLGIYPPGTEVTYQPHIDMRTAQGTIVPLLASQSDVLASDWQIYVEPKIGPDGELFP